MTTLFLTSILASGSLATLGDDGPLGSLIARLDDGDAFVRLNVSRDYLRRFAHAAVPVKFLYLVLFLDPGVRKSNSA